MKQILVMHDNQVTDEASCRQKNLRLRIKRQDVISRTSADEENDL